MILSAATPKKKQWSACGLKIIRKLNHKIIKGYAIPAVLIIF